MFPLSARDAHLASAIELGLAFPLELGALQLTAD